MDTIGQIKKLDEAIMLLNKKMADHKSGAGFHTYLLEQLVSNLRDMEVKSHYLGKRVEKLEELCKRLDSNQDKG